MARVLGAASVLTDNGCSLAHTGDGPLTASQRGKVSVLRERRPVPGELGWLPPSGPTWVEACEPPRRLLLRMRDPDAQPGQPEQTVIEARLFAQGNDKAPARFHRRRTATSHAPRR